MACLWTRLKKYWNNDGYYIVELSPQELEEEQHAKREMLAGIKSVQLRLKETRAEINKQLVLKRQAFVDQANYSQQYGVEDESIRSTINSLLRRIETSQQQLRQLLLEEEKAESAYQAALNTMESDRLRKRTLWFSKKVKLPQEKEVSQDVKNLNSVGKSIVKSNQLSAESAGAAGDTHVDPITSRCVELKMQDQYDRELQDAKHHVLKSKLPTVPTRMYGWEQGQQTATEVTSGQPPPPPRTVMTNH